MKTIYSILLAVLFSTSTFAATELQTSVSAAPTAAPKWKTNITSYYYNFEGTRASDEAAYEFADSTLDMQLFSLQYQLSPSWTLLILGQHLNNYVETKMAGMVFKDRTKGLGDTFVSGITPLYASSEYLLLADIGASLPTGSINLKNESNPNSNYAYNMQMGSGTVDAVTGLTAMTFQGAVQAGGHLTAIFRNGRNANGYSLGSLYKVDSWVDYNTSFGLTPRLVGYYKHKDAINGVDETLGENPYTRFYHSAQINWDVSAALKYAKTAGPVTVALEAGAPLAQDSSNYDHVAVSTQYFGNLSVTGTW
ncbi:MAG: hypothetical protein ACXWC9_05795 [Pseudobdellovibrionaceae bacterium]